MSQRAYVNAFRARLRRLGYTDISIKKYKFTDQEVYHVIARDPLFGLIGDRYMLINDLVLWR